MITATHPVLRRAALLAAGLAIAASSAVARPVPAAASASQCDTSTIVSTSPLSVGVHVTGCGDMGDATYQVTAELVEHATGAVLQTWSSGASVEPLVDGVVSVPVGGRWDLFVTSTSDAHGQQIQSANVMVDDDGLVTIDAPQVVFMPGLMDGTKVPGEVRWSRAGDTPASRYRVERRTGTGDWALLDTTSGTSMRVTLRIGQDVAFRVRGVGADGRRGPARETELLPALRRDDDSAGIEYGGTWRVASATRAFGGSTHYAKAAGRAATFEVDGTAAAIVVTTGPGNGSFKVFVDGVYRRTVKTVAGSVRYRQVVYAVQWTGEPAVHEIRIEVVGTAGHPRVDLDAVLVR